MRDVDEDSRAHGQLPDASPTSKAREIKDPGEMKSVPALHLPQRTARAEKDRQ